MTSIEFLCNQFDVRPSCSDEELRRAYHQLLFKNHPDRNRDDPAATERTQQINQAYAELKARRSHSTVSTTNSINVDLSVRFGRDLQEVTAERKTHFRDTWDALQDQPTDPLRALRFIHAAFEAERANSEIVKPLLFDSIVIDVASMLLSLDIQQQGGAVQAALHRRCDTLVRWADVLWDVGRSLEAINILEDAFNLAPASPALKEALRSLHYRTSQYPNKTTGEKTGPGARVSHLRRIIELGYNLDYINKLLAEAYHELGEDEHARTCLERAYTINPGLTGAARITRTLGLSSSRGAADRPQATVKSRWGRPAQIPAPAQIRAWAGKQQWDLVLEFANPDDYSRAILPRARDTLRTISKALGSCSHPAAIEALTILMRFNYYYDVAQAAVTSLAKVGDAGTLAALKEFGRARGDGAPAVGWKGALSLQNCISYLQARVGGSHAIARGKASDLVIRAKREAGNGDYGLARFLLENAVGDIATEASDYLETMLLLARSCAAMNDIDRAVEIAQGNSVGICERNDRSIIDEVDNWLWEKAFMEEYHEGLDSLYQWALDLNLHLVTIARRPEEALAPLCTLTRWLEKLGDGATANMIRDLIRMEAPGTGFVDAHDRANYVTPVTLSEEMSKFLRVFEARIKSEAFTRVKDLMGSPRSL